MQERTFRRYLEIPLYVVALAVSIGSSTIALIKQELNPDPTDPYCTPITYPVDCTKADNPQCRGEGGSDIWYPLTIAVIIIAFSTLIITMALVVHSFYKNERKLRKAVKDNQIEEGDETYQILQRAQESASIITRQALLYITAFSITWLFGFIQIALFTEPNDTLFALRMIFQPSQGFFNLLIFVYHKVQTLRHADDDLTVSEALEIVFIFPGRMEDQAAVSNLDIVIDQFVLDQIRNLAAAMNQARCGFNNNAAMSGSHLSEEEVSSDDISPFQPTATGSSMPVSSPQSNHGGLSLASSTTSVFVPKYNGLLAAIQSRNKESNGVTMNPNVVAGGISSESFNDDVATVNDGLSGFSFSSLISRGSADC